MTGVQTCALPISANQPDAANEAEAVEIEKLVYGGAGLARRDGQVLLAPYVLPGERVKLEPVKRGPEARVVERLTDSPERIAAPCPYFGQCGGCQYQHAQYAAQLQWKVGILKEQFARVGKFEFPGEIQVVSGPEYGYRNRSQFQMVEGRIGYFEEGSHHLVPVKDCAITSPTIIDALKKLRNIFPVFIKRFEFFTNGTEVQLNVLDTEKPIAKRFFEACAEIVPGILSPALDYTVGEDVFRVAHGSFFQVNRFLIDKMLEVSLAGVKGGELAFDLYCGVGLFTLPLARKFERVTGVELGTSATRDLETNLERAQVKNVKGIKNLAESWLAGVTETPDFVLADPPRAGLGKQAVAELVRLKARELVLVSCDPATLARDLAGLKAGGFDVHEVTLIDLFPQTYHLETIVRLRHAG